ncbi:hypothetical protein CLIB1423_27S00254 [[Candida] railenensis]|uniref:Uncharacterized protein n=1 Tax=[Candida] railenensis TaxID=45579 RepID=A0A9P0QUZ9_9ASCO|nr:hypothetical protein CLIB1423_27S00254 [[Candida] railenensis]
MSKGYLNHPLIRNPLKWLAKRKYITPEEYATSFYNTDSIRYNPQAQLLSSGTAMNTGTRDIYSKGSMVRLTMDNDGNSNDNYYLVPAINSPYDPHTLFPRSYILNNWLFVSLIANVRDTWKKYVPLKFRTKNNPSINAHTKILPDIEDVIPKIYLRNIVEGTLKVEREATVEHRSPSDGVWLDFHNAKFGSGHLSVHGVFLNSLKVKFGGQQRVFLPYCEENQKILKNLVTLNNYFRYK